MFGIACPPTLLLWTCHPNAVPDAVWARRFTLVDAGAQTFAELKLADDGPEPYLLKTSGVARVSLVHNR